MQTKKEEIQQAIFKSAENEFLEKGFEKASLRQIVKKAGTSLGNFYNYYENKEALFVSIVEGAYIGMMQLVNNHNQWEGNDVLLDLTDVAVWRRELRRLILPIVPAITTPFVILIEGSQGTQFAHAKEDLLAMMEEHFMEHIEEFNPKYPNPQMAKVMAEQLIFGLVMIVKNHKDDEMRQQLIIEEILFFAIGIMGILKTS
ncbi:TetR/AcrR family transcriptional regulator [Gottschalkiaceae bacterium SANA]|nr:TetR/AcrR family transcriptional regulator [Gottschalkiaceae bacterium SANA]